MIMLPQFSRMISLRQIRYDGRGWGGHLIIKGGIPFYGEIATAKSLNTNHTF